MYITKKEAKTLLNEVFRPQIKEVICALESVESAITVSSPSFVSISDTYLALSTDSFIETTANSFTVSLPTAVGIAGKKYTIKNTGLGTITVDPSGAETIDGDPTYDITAQYEALTVLSNGTNWLIT